MADGRRPMILSSPASFSAEQVARRKFAIVRKGFDPADVEAFLEWVASGIEAASQREEELRRRLEEAERRASNPQIDEDTMTAVLGQETARVLRSAHDAAAEVTARAEENAERIRREAQEEARGAHERAAAAAAERSREAEEASVEVRRAAQEEAERTVRVAHADAEQARNAAREECREMVREAQELRARILADMARRRRVLLTQVEQLRAGRGSLSDAVDHVRRAVEQLHEDLRRADDDARAAAESAAKKVAAEPEPPAEQLQSPNQGAPVGSEPGGRSPAGPDAGPEADPPDASLAGRPAPSARSGSEPSPHEGGSSEAGYSEASPAEAGPAGGGEGGPFSPTASAPGSSPGAPVTSPASGVTERPRPAASIAQALSRILEPAEERGERAESGAGSLEDGPDGPDDEDRRSSSLRIIKRARRARSREPAGPPEPEGGAAGPAAEALEPGEKTEPAHAEAPVQAAEGSSRTATMAAERVEAIFAEIRAGRAAGATKEAPDPAAAASGRDDEVAQADDAAATQDALGRDEPAAIATLDEARGAAARGLAEPAEEIGSAGAGKPVAPTAEGDEALLQQRNTAIEPICASLSRKLKRALQDEQNDTLDRLRSNRDRSAAGLLGSSEDQQRALSAVCTEFMDQAAVAGARFAGGERLLKDRARQAIAGEQAAELARAVGGALHRRLEEGLSELASGDETGVVDHIGAVYREWKGRRVERLAADQVAAAFSRGVLAATSLGAALRWVVDDEGAHCPDCDDNALAGPVKRGERYPTGQAYPPAHAGCRCLLVPSRA